jgi:hypothetical protein
MMYQKEGRSALPAVVITVESTRKLSDNGYLKAKKHC